MRDLAEAQKMDRFPPAGMDCRGVANNNTGGVKRLPKRATFPADRLTVPARVC